jgi:uncharacterized membrane protein YhdT
MKSQKNTASQKPARRLHEPFEMRVSAAKKREMKWMLFLSVAFLVGMIVIVYLLRGTGWPVVIGMLMFLAVDLLIVDQMLCIWVKRNDSIKITEQGIEAHLHNGTSFMSAKNHEVNDVLLWRDITGCWVNKDEFSPNDPPKKLLLQLKDKRQKQYELNYLEVPRDLIGRLSPNPSL